MVKADVMGFIPLQGHLFSGLVQLDAVRRVAGFFRKHFQRVA